MMQINLPLWNEATSYNNPSLFAGWYLGTIEGNLFLNGSAPAEQNHSSMMAHLGAVASWSVVEQVPRLLACQTHLTAKRCSNNSLAYVGSLKYKSRLQDQAALDDKTAKKSSLNRRTTSYGLLSTKQVVVSSLLSMVMFPSYGQLAELKLAMSTSLSAMGRDVFAKARLRSITSANMNSALMVN
jgi:hypothetical protein